MKKHFSLIVIAILSVIMFVACSNNDTPSAVVEAYYGALANEDYDTAFALMVNKDGEPMDEETRTMLKGMIQSKVKKAKEEGTEEDFLKSDFEIVSEKIDKDDPDKAVVKVKTTKKTETVDCLKVDGKWYVLWKK